MRSIKIILIVFFSINLIACGSSDTSGSNDSNSSNPPTGGVVRTGVAFGPVDGFGSIIVNGVRYATNNATFTIDDMTGSESDLAVGQVVTLKIETDDNGSARANEVIYDDDVEGPIDSIDLVNNQLVVLGQTVIVNAATVFDDSIDLGSLEGLMTGDIVEVSGLYNADGILVASYIEDKPGQTEYEVHGVVSNLDTANARFDLNALTVDYSQAVLSDFASASIANGDFVEVKGSAFVATGELLATEVELESNDDRLGEEDENAEIEGFITEFDSVQSFQVAGVPVITNANTIYENGVEADLALNIRIEVEGNFNANGELVADKVQFRPDENIEVSSTIDSVDVDAQMLVIFGIEFRVDANTSFDDGSSADLAVFSLADLSPGDYLELRGYKQDGVLIASRIKRDDPEQRNEIQGPVENVSMDSLVILGITIETNAATEYEDIDETVLSSTEFFSRVMVGDLVRARGDKTSSTSMIAEQLEFEN